MIAIPQQARIFVCIPSLDFRNGITGLANQCKVKFKEDPMSGALFVFKNRSNQSLKILYYDGMAFWLLTRRLSRGKIKWWPSGETDACNLEAKQLQMMIIGGNPETAEFTDDWKKIIR